MIFIHTNVPNHNLVKSSSANKLPLDWFPLSFYKVFIKNMMKYGLKEKSLRWIKN